MTKTERLVKISQIDRMFREMGRGPIVVSRAREASDTEVEQVWRRVRKEFRAWGRWTLSDLDRDFSPVGRR